MNGSKPAALASTLLFAKGRARPVAYDVDQIKAIAPVRVDPLPRPPTHYVGTRRGRNPPGEVKLSFHVDADRHRRLKLAMAHLRQTGQELVIDAVDHYLEHVVPRLLGQRCACLEAGRPASGSRASGRGTAACFCEPGFHTSGATDGRSS